MKILEADECEEMEIPDEEGFSKPTTFDFKQTTADQRHKWRISFKSTAWTDLISKFLITTSVDKFIINAVIFYRREIHFAMKASLTVLFI